MLKGRCTSEGTAAYTAGHGKLPAGHWRTAAGCTVGSVGLGSYLGAWDDATDKRYAEAVQRAVQAGINVLDTAVNYRFQRSERAIGRGLAKAAAGGLARESVLVCTKGGYVPFDGAPPDDPDAWIEEHLVKRGLAPAEEIVDGHCMSPAYLRDQVEASRRNLGLETIDVYYVHNPEQQRPALSEDAFYERLTRAFAALEECASEGKLQWYGTATWAGYRVPREAPNALSLERVIACARAAGGERHRFRFVQLPFNLQFVEALTLPAQRAGGRDASLLEAAHEAGLTAFTSVPLMQGRLLGRLEAEARAHFPRLTTDAQRLVQFARSAPGVTAPLVGMSRTEHVDEMARLLEAPPMTPEAFGGLFG